MMDMIINVIFFIFHVLGVFNLAYLEFEVFLQLQSGYVVVAMILLFCVIVIQVRENTFCFTMLTVQQLIAIVVSTSSVITKVQRRIARWRKHRRSKGASLSGNV